MSRTITPVILSGGAGTRLWPLSSDALPKQFHALGAGDETLLQMTARRACGESFTPPVVIAGERHAEIVERQLGAAGVDPRQLILEPCPRNTAPAIALAALASDPDELLLVMPSDHLIADVAAFRSAVAAAASFAEAGWLVTFGIRPERPETGYGYIRRGEAIGDGVFAARAFVEKPDLATAERYVADGCHDWNGGIFLFSAAALLEALDRHAPQIASAARAAMADAERDGMRLNAGARAFAASPAQSIDYAVMEKAERVAVVPVAMGWSDVGSWDALHALGGGDEAGNVTAGDVLAIGSSGCLLRSDGPALTAVGAQDLIIVAAGGAVLVVPRGESQRVKEVVDALARRRQKAGGAASDGEV